MCYDSLVKIASNGKNMTIGYFGGHFGFLMMTQLSNHINNPSIGFRVPRNLGIEPNITSIAQILTE